MALDPVTPGSPLAPAVAALGALAAGRGPDAARSALADAPAGASLLVDALRTHLEQAPPGGGSVYDQPAAFAAFIRGGGNTGLYEAVAAALAERHDALAPSAVLDVGCGDALALAAALAARGPRAVAALERLDLVEPSAPLLAAARERLAGALPGVEVGARAQRLQEVLAGDGGADPGGAGPRWPLAQSTFALHTLPHEERTAALVALRPLVGELAVVEFDVPDAAVGSPEHVRFLAGTYERGLAEYPPAADGGDRELVAQGFLMPVLTGQLAPGAVRATWEQPAAAWVAQLRDAGWRDVAARPLHDYWSSPAFALTARGGA